jgi:hypothetical protein
MALVEALLEARAPLPGKLFRKENFPEKRKARAADSCARRSTQGRSLKNVLWNLPE